MIVLEYFKDVCFKSVLIILLLSLYFVMLGGLMHLMSNFLRKKFADVFGLKTYIYLTAPGVMVHESGHALFCLVFRHKILEMKLFSPENDGTLGYVTHSYNVNSLYQRVGNFFIGTGPLWLGLAVLYFISYLLLPQELVFYDLDSGGTQEQFGEVLFSGAFWGRWHTWVWFYFFITVSSHMTLSRPDMKGALDGFLFLILTVVVFEVIFCRIETVNLYVIEKVVNLGGFVIMQISSILMFIFLFSIFFWFLAALRKRRTA